MTYPDPPSPPNMPLPFSGGNVGDFWPQPPMNKEYLNSQSQFENNPPPFKRSRNSENNPPNFAPFPPTNPIINPPNLPVNKGTTHIFYKTRMCAKYIEGNCRHGDNCTFAHGAEDLREPPPNWQDLVRDRGAGNWNDDQRIIHRMKICKKFYNGEECPYREKCNFLHERSAKFKPDLAIEMAMERTRESSVINVATMGPHMDHRARFDQPEFSRHLSSSSDAIRVSVTADSDVSRVNVNANSDAFRATVKPSYWKTKMCTKWEITGQCMFGDRCHFAHGLSELKAPGGRVEAETLMNTAPVVAKAVVNVPIVSDAPPTNAVAVAVPAKEGEAKAFFARWKGQGRISRIYADWIDDDDEEEQIPSPGMPSQVET